MIVFYFSLLGLGEGERGPSNGEYAEVTPLRVTRKYNCNALFGAQRSLMRNIALSLILGAMTMPIAMAQQPYGWQVHVQYSSFWQLWKPLMRIDNNSKDVPRVVKTPRPTIPLPGSNQVTGSKFQGCPWSKEFEQLMDEPYAIALPSLAKVLHVDYDYVLIGNAPDEIEIPPRSRLVVEYRYFQTKGFESWHWVEPRPGDEFRGVKPDPANLGPHRREINQKLNWQMRYKITPL